MLDPYALLLALGAAIGWGCLGFNLAMVMSRGRWRWWEPPRDR